MLPSLLDSYLLFYRVQHVKRKKKRKTNGIIKPNRHFFLFIYLRLRQIKIPVITRSFVCRMRIGFDTREEIVSSLSYIEKKAFNLAEYCQIDIDYLYDTVPLHYLLYYIRPSKFTMRF